MTRHFVSSNALKVQKKLILGWSHSVFHIVTIHLPIEVLWNNLNELTLPLWDISCYTFSSWMASHQYESFHVSLSDLFVQMSCQNVNLWMASCQCDSFMFFHTTWINKCLVTMWTMEWLLASVSYSMLFKCSNSQILWRNMKGPTLAWSHSIVHIVTRYLSVKILWKYMTELILQRCHSVVHIVTRHLHIQVLLNNMK